MAARRTCLEAAFEVLEASEQPLRVEEIAQRMLDQGLWVSSGKTPAATVGARIGEEIKARGSTARFERVSPGTFRARTLS